MFNKKNNPLVESVKAVMKQNEVHRQAEAALNEELGISSKKALPHEYHAQYDALLEAKVKMTPVTGNQGEIDVSGPRGKPDNMVSKHDFKELGLRSKKAAGKLEEKATEEQKAKIKKVMSHWKAGKQHIGKSEETVPKTKEGQKQAVAIALNQAKLSKKINENEYFETESVIDEIRENLEENLIAIHESGDDELFENYVNSLTEEELEILGLAEDWRSAAFGDNTSGGSLSNAGYRTPPSVAAAQARGAARQARPAPSPAARPAPTAAKPKPATPYIDSDAERATPGGGLAPKQARTQNAVPDKPYQPPIPSTMSGFEPAGPAVMPKPEPGTTGTGSTGRPTSAVVRTVPTEQPRVKKPQPTGGSGPMPDLPPMAEQVKPQIKESLESFVRNRFLKG